MKNFLNRLIYIFPLIMSIVIFSSCTVGGNRWSVKSPDGKASISVQLGALDEAGYPAGQTRLYYKVEYRGQNGKQTIIPNSPLGIKRNDQSFVDSLIFKSKSEVKTIDEKYTLVHGKRKENRNYANEITLFFENENAAQLSIVLRAYNDGIAFRYQFPEESTELYTVTDELTGFRLPVDAVGFMLPYDDPTMWTPAYENFYMRDVKVGTPSPINAGWALPVLFRINDGQNWVLITESALDGTYFGARLHQQVSNNIYRIRMPDEGEGYGTGDVIPSSSLPWQTPWRVIITGSTLAQVVETSIVTDLSPPSSVQETDWIRPGHVSWSWWSESDSPRNFETLMSFVDLAAEMGWEYSLVDANWNLEGYGMIRDLVNYANKKGVGILLWYNSGGSHNIVTEQPRDLMFDREVRRSEFKKLQEIGVKGVKVDFFQSDKQNIISLYHDILQDAADFEMMVNFHGCTLPRGWSRTYPHLMSMEAVRGAECYKFDARYPEKSPWHNTILTFTRNVVGPMDYTPVTFSDVTYPHLTTWAHELALSVVFESGWVHMADRCEAYLGLPETVKEFLKQVPAAWDDIHFVDGYPGKYTVIARKDGENWYVGGINGQNEPLTINAVMSFLGEGAYSMTFIGDGQKNKSFDINEESVIAGESVKVDMHARGGFVLKIEKI
ncbi:glycoside hydrolase family 97 catalytic domain-containing protein [candidate division KSB1 bacterium]|nr:glycoside hydrolase family 97 catalytic domain-containing protein [candidate division KSB1 bacterium]